MLIFSYVDNNPRFEPIERDVEWHIGEKSPTEMFSYDILENCHRVQADGDELVSITGQFRNIPYHFSAGVQVWYGDMAKFIVNNIK